jgi:hypothetical protein
MADGLGWLLLYSLAQAGWYQCGHGTMAADMAEKCVWRLILITFCVLFYMGAIIVVAENRLISNINHKMF